MITWDIILVSQLEKIKLSVTLAKLPNIISGMLGSTSLNGNVVSSDLNNSEMTWHHYFTVHIYQLDNFGFFYILWDLRCFLWPVTYICANTLYPFYLFSMGSKYKKVQQHSQLGRTIFQETVRTGSLQQRPEAVRLCMTRTIDSARLIFNAESVGCYYDLIVRI